MVGGGVRVDVNEELKFCENSKKKSGRGRGGGGQVDVNEIFFEKIKTNFFFGGGVGGVGGGGSGSVGGQSGCDGVFVKIQKKTIFGGGGSGGGSVGGSGSGWGSEWM